MMVFQVIGGHFYEGTETVGIYTTKRKAVNAARKAFAGQDWKRDGDRCFDFVRVDMIALDHALAASCLNPERTVFEASKDNL